MKKGIEESVTNGVVGGYQVIDFYVEIVDGSYHDVDSNELAFKLAAIFAMKDAFKKGKLDPSRTDHESGVCYAR